MMQLVGGTRVVLRPLAAEDRDLVVAAFDRLSPRSRYRRFLSPTPRLTSSRAFAAKLHRTT